MRSLLVFPLLAFQPVFANEQPPALVPHTGSAQQGQIAVPAAGREKPEPAESSPPQDRSRPLFEGRASVSATLSFAPSRPQSVMVSLLFTNLESPPITLDDAKFFVLDGEGRQLRRLSLEEVKYPIQYLVAQVSGSGGQPPVPPPPQRSYAIAAVPDGTYTFTESPERAAGDDPAAHLLGSAAGSSPHPPADRSRIDQILQQAQMALSRWDSSYFRSQAPLAPGENRTGNIVYWNDSLQPAQGPFQLVLFVTDPSNGRQEMVKFDFR